MASPGPSQGKRMFFGDPGLVQKVREALAAIPPTVEKRLVTADVVADSIIAKHRKYKRTARGPLRLSIARIMTSLNSESKGGKQDPSKRQTGIRRNASAPSLGALASRKRMASEISRPSTPTPSSATSLPAKPATPYPTALPKNHEASPTLGTHVEEEDDLDEEEMEAQFEGFADPDVDLAPKSKPFIQNGRGVSLYGHKRDAAARGAKPVVNSSSTSTSPAPKTLPPSTIPGTVPVPPPPGLDASASSTSGTPIAATVAAATVAATTPTSAASAPTSAAPASSSAAAAAATTTATTAGPQSEQAGRKRRRLTGSQRREMQRAVLSAIDPASVPTPTSYASKPPTARLNDVAGLSEETIKSLEWNVFFPIMQPGLLKSFAPGMELTTGVLLHGPRGCGKSLLAAAIAGEMSEIGVSYKSVSAPDLVSGMSGESEQQIRALFREARNDAPCIIFIDEIDAIFPKGDGNRRGMETRMVAAFSTCMDELRMDSARKPTSSLQSSPSDPTSETKTSESEMKGDSKTSVEEDKDAPPLEREPDSHTKPVLVIAATNKAKALDVGVRKRFTSEIAMNIPDATGRERILKVLAKKMVIAGDVDFEELAKETPGMVGSDLSALCKEAASNAVRRVWTQVAGPTNRSNFLSRMKCVTTDQVTNQECAVKHEDFMEATKTVQPSATREGFATVPDVTWDDIGALEEIRAELEMSMVRPILDAKMFKRMGLGAPSGVLLYGPPGCGKTLLAKAMANQSCVNFISVKGPELLDKYVGESEAHVREVFERASSSAPCVVFFDELDALAPRRGSSAGGSGVSERVVNQLLTLMDGVTSRKGVYLMGATNRPDMLDAALIRPGRFDKELYVPLPSAKDRGAILRTALRDTPVSKDVDPEVIGSSDLCNGFSGADIAGLVREATMMALERHYRSDSADSDCVVENCDFERAVARITPSVSQASLVQYERRLKRKQRGRRSPPAAPATPGTVIPASPGTAIPAIPANDGADLMDVIEGGGGGGGGGGGSGNSTVASSAADSSAVVSTRSERDVRFGGISSPSAEGGGCGTGSDSKNSLRSSRGSRNTVPA